MKETKNEIKKRYVISINQSAVFALCLTEYRKELVRQLAGPDEYGQPPVRKPPTPAVSQFVQIINTGLHWVCLSTTGCQNGLVKVYDSLGIMPSATAIWNACQMAYQKLQQQKGSSDCGLLAIAFATSLCFGDNPPSIKYAQPLLRNHFISCLETLQMKPFPKTDERVSSHSSASKVVEPKKVKSILTCGSLPSIPLCQFLRRKHLTTTQD